MSDAPATNTCTFIFKKSTRKAGLRSRQPVEKEQDSDLSSSSGDETTIVTKDRKRKSNPLIQSTRTFSGVKRRITGKVDQDSSDDEDEGKLVASLAYRSDRSANMQGPEDAGATATLEIDTEADKDARAIFERARKMQEEGIIDDEGKTYKGINNYKKFIVAKDNTCGELFFYSLY